MASSKHAKWMVVYKAPADGYRHEHVAHVNTVDDEAFARLVFLQNSPDAQIISCKGYKDPMEVFKKAEQLKAAGGPDWQPLHGEDFALTKRKVREMSLRFADIAKRATTGILDAGGQPVLSLDDRSALLAGEVPPSAAHVVADNLVEARIREGTDE